MPDPRALPEVEVIAACNRGGCPKEGVCGSAETPFIFQGSYPFSETNFQDFSKTFQGLGLIFQGL